MTFGHTLWAQKFTIWALRVEKKTTLADVGHVQGSTGRTPVQWDLPRWRKWSEHEGGYAPYEEAVSTAGETCPYVAAARLPGCLTLRPPTLPTPEHFDSLIPRFT